MPMAQGFARPVAKHPWIAPSLVPSRPAPLMPALASLGACSSVCPHTESALSVQSCTCPGIVANCCSAALLAQYIATNSPMHAKFGGVEPCCDAARMLDVDWAIPTFALCGMGCSHARRSRSTCSTGQLRCCCPTHVLRRRSPGANTGNLRRGWTCWTEW